MTVCTDEDANGAKSSAQDSMKLLGTVQKCTLLTRYTFDDVAWSNCPGIMQGLDQAKPLKEDRIQALDNRVYPAPVYESVSFYRVDRPYLLPHMICDRVQALKDNIP